MISYNVYNTISYFISANQWRSRELALARSRGGRFWREEIQILTVITDAAPQVYRLCAAESGPWREDVTGQSRDAVG